MFSCLGDLGTKSKCEAGTPRHWHSEKCGQRPAARTRFGFPTGVLSKKLRVNRRRQGQAWGRTNWGWSVVERMAGAAISHQIRAANIQQPHVLS